MKRKISLSLKLTLIVVLVSAVIILSLTYVNIYNQKSFFERNYSEKASALAKSFDASIAFHNAFNDTEQLQRYIENINDSNSELLQINLNIPSDNDSTIFYVFVSSNINLIGSQAEIYNFHCYDRTIREKEDAKYYGINNINGSYLITVYAPVNLSGEIAGSYEMIFSMDKDYKVFDEQMRTLIALSVFSILLSIFSFLFLLRRFIVKPIFIFRNAAKLIGEGNLDTEININSQDELGELADAFDKMTKDLKKSRVKIERYNKTLERLLDQKDEFIGQLGHDLKNPLTPLVGLLPIIRDQEKDPKIKEHLDVIVHNVEYMQELIFKTLQLARLRSENITFDFEDLNLKSEIDDVLENQRLYLKEHKMNVLNKIHNDYVVKADKLRLAELFNNLITNAVKYTKETGGTLSFNAKKEKNMAVVSITDTGIGMTKKQLDQIFDEFYKADRSTQEYESSGLGLSICERIVKKHGGRIWAESPGPGKGSTFYFTLKLRNNK